MEENNKIRVIITIRGTNNNPSVGVCIENPDIRVDGWPVVYNENFHEEDRWKFIEVVKNGDRRFLLLSDKRIREEIEEDIREGISLDVTLRDMKEEIKREISSVREGVRTIRYDADMEFGEESVDEKKKKKKR